MKNKFVGLDLLRFLLAVYLMVFHSIHQYPQSAEIPFVELLNLGGFATSTFFLLSGFILTHVYFAQTSELRGGTRAFFVKRLSNLYPIHLISLALLLLVSVAGTRAFNEFATLSLSDAADELVYLGHVETAFNFVLNLAMVQVWNPPYGSVNPSSWSLATLLFFYITFPFLAPRMLAVRKKALLLLLLWVAYMIPPIVASSMHWFGPVAVGIVTRNPVLRLPEFASGIVLYGLYREQQLSLFTETPGRRFLALVFVAVSFATAAWLVADGALYWRYIVHNGALMPAEMALVIVCAPAALPVGFAKLSVRLGNAALSIFAIHAPIFLVLIKILKLSSLGQSPLTCAAHFSACVAASKDVLPSMATYPLYLIGAVIAAVYFQERVVAPVRDKIRRRFLQKPATQETAESAARS
ncbi:acyltransferase family protein [Caballeronia sp. DA-9]|uniref:acyltransferase family protein n=1 Tax=Caballeronia sp. DA-9 TaxID=3436237 RepID=UPI003F680FC8